MSTQVQASLTDGQETTAVLLTAGSFNLSISGSFTGTVTVKRSPDNVTFFDVDTFTAPTEEVGTDPENTYYKVGYAGTGTAVIRIGEYQGT